jgi:hypothetical protein
LARTEEEKEEEAIAAKEGFSFFSQKTNGSVSTPSPPRLERGERRVERWRRRRAWV